MYPVTGDSPVILLTVTEWSPWGGVTGGWGGDCSIDTFLFSLKGRDLGLTWQPQVSRHGGVEDGCGGRETRIQPLPFLMRRSLLNSSKAPVCWNWQPVGALGSLAGGEAYEEGVYPSACPFVKIIHSITAGSGSAKVTF